MTPNSITKQFIADLTPEDLRNLEVALNKLSCAKQAVRPDGMTSLICSLEETKKFFREAIFSLADAETLVDFFWLNLAKKYSVAKENLQQLYLDYNSSKLYLINPAESQS